MNAAALRELVMPVVIVAASEPGATSCATTTTSYVSLQPPVLCLSLRPGSRTAQMVLRTGRFSVSVLAADQADLAQRAGQKGMSDDKISEMCIETEQPPDSAGAPAPPGVGGAAAVLWCEKRDAITVGDHLMFLGEVIAFRGAPPEASLLLRHQRRYLATGEAKSGYAPEGYPI